MQCVREKILAEIEKTNYRLKELRRQLRALSAIGEWLPDYPDDITAPEATANGEMPAHGPAEGIPESTVQAPLSRHRGRREAVAE